MRQNELFGNPEQLDQEIQEEVKEFEEELGHIKFALEEWVRENLPKERPIIPGIDPRT